MNSNPSASTKVDMATQRKRTLAKIYSLLIEFAEEDEILTSDTPASVGGEKVDVPTQDKCDLPKPEILNSDGS